MEHMKPSFKPLANELEEYLQHNLDIITDSPWFEEKLAKAVKQTLREMLDEKSSSHDV